MSMIEIMAQLSEHKSTLTAILVALIGLAGLFPLRRYLAVRAAVIAFKGAFVNEIASIRNSATDHSTFTDAFEKHRNAVDTIMPVLRKRHQKKLQKAWNDYCGEGSDIDAETFIAGNSIHPDLFPNFVNRFNELHSCLDDLL
jgi:hypothetical protein